MNIVAKLKEKLSLVSKDDVVNKLGYSSLVKAEKTLDKFLKYEDLHSWVSSGHYDFKYTSTQFFEKLCQILGVLDDEIYSAFEEQRAYQKELDRLGGCYIFVNTNFKRENQPIHVLAFAGGLRNLGLPLVELVFKTDEEVFDVVSRLVVKHHSTLKDGALAVWGEVVNYQYHHSDGEVYVFGINGELEESEIVQESRASLSVGGKVFVS